MAPPEEAPPARADIVDGRDDEMIARAAEHLRAGALVAFPTETVYGLGAIASNDEAVASIFEAKGRPQHDPLIVHLSSINQLSSVFAPKAFTRRARLLAAHFWPGPLTLVAQRAEGILDRVTSGLDTVAVRVPAHPIALRLIREVGEPIVAPSANPFMYVSPTTAEHVRQQLGERVALIVDGGPCNVGVESTIVRVPDTGPVEVLRQGGVPIELLVSVLGEPVMMAPRVLEKPLAPGQFARHYAPRVELRLIATDVSAPPDTRADALLVVSGAAPAWADGYAQVRTLAPDGDLAEAARHVFACLRELDGDPTIRSLDVMLPPAEGLGNAIRDRLVRAATREANADEQSHKASDGY